MFVSNPTIQGMQGKFGAKVKKMSCEDDGEGQKGCYRFFVRPSPAVPALLPVQGGVLLIILVVVSGKLKIF